MQRHTYAAPGKSLVVYEFMTKLLNGEIPLQRMSGCTECKRDWVPCRSKAARDSWREQALPRTLLARRRQDGHRAFHIHAGRDNETRTRAATHGSCQTVRVRS